MIFLKGENGKRSADNGINKDVLVHRCYGAVSIDGKPYRVKITLKEDPRDVNFPHITHSYEATKIELIAGTWENQEGPSPNTINSISATNLLENVGMSYNPSKKVLDASRERGEKIREQKVSDNLGVDLDQVRFFRIADGHAYGFTVGGKIYIDPRIATAETVPSARQNLQSQIRNLDEQISMYGGFLAEYAQKAEAEQNAAITDQQSEQAYQEEPKAYQEEGLSTQSDDNAEQINESATNSEIQSAEQNKENTNQQKVAIDDQGNPLNADGTLKVDAISSIDDLADEDFMNPTRSIQLPTLPQNVADAIGSEGKPVVIKKNIFEKNARNHQFTSEQSRDILTKALYETELVGKANPRNKQNYWVAIKVDENSPIVVLEVSHKKENVEIVSWYSMDERNLERIKRQAERNGGELIMLSKGKVESLSTPTQGLSSASEDKQTSEENKTSFADERSNIQGLESYTRSELKSIVADYVQAKLTEQGIEARVLEVDIHGSRNRRDARADSDLDVVIEYEGDMPEDSMFNILNDENEERLSVEGITVDINPIRKEETGTLNEYMQRSLKYDEEKLAQARQIVEDKQGAKTPSASEVALRDAVIDRLRESGVEVIDDAEAGQQVLDMANGKDVRMSAKKRRALETVSVSRSEEHPQTVISSADGTKVLNNLDTLAKNYENATETKEKTFIGEVAKSLGMTDRGKSSQYATFETKNGKIVTIRLSNHNATVSNFDNNGETDGISIVVSAKKNEGVYNDGNAHITEYYYDAIKLRKAEGKPLADIVRSIKQALYSGEFKDTTGLAEVQEVNADNAARLQKVYHGSGAEFDHFDHSHMGEGEGAQAYGWGTYVTEVEGIGKTYAKASISRKINSLFDQCVVLIRDKMYSGASFEDARNKIVENLERILGPNGEKARNIEEAIARLKTLSESDVPKRVLYTVEIPDDNGSNYFQWNKIYKDDALYSSLNKIGKVLEAKGIDLNKEYNQGTSWNTWIERLKIDGEDWTPNVATGKEIYEKLSRMLGENAYQENQEKASHILADVGFTGIKYPADYLRGGREDGAMNYVIFNEADAKITDQVRFFRIADGHAYGFTVGGKIYIDPRIATAETPIHEYAHLWATALRQTNPKEWENIVGLMKGTGIWKEVKRLYPGLKTDSEIADEVLAHYSGRRGAERLREAAAKITEGKGSVLKQAEALSALQQVKDAIDKFWKAVCDFLHIHYTSAEEVADRVMKDLLEGVNPRSESSEARLRAEAESFAEKHGINAEDVVVYGRAMQEGNLQGATLAYMNIRRTVRLENVGMSLFTFANKFKKEVGNELRTRFGDIEALQKEYDEKALAERNVMEAARKKAEAEEAERQKALDALSVLSDEEIDNRYMSAIEREDDAEARTMLDEAARRRGYADTESDYQGVGAWAAPSNPGYESDEARRADFEANTPDVNIEDMALGYSSQPDDYFYHPERYSQNTPYGRESTKAIRDAIDALKRGEKDVKVKVYRAVPTDIKESKLRNGDWVTPSRKYAEMHGAHRLDGKYRIIEDEVPAAQLWWDANDANEFGFDDGKKYRYKNTKNNRKSDDLVTRDDNGNIIPPSMRFNQRKSDIRYSRTVFGGNSGYVGYSMSRRAAQAREDGKYPKTDFKKEYKVKAASFNALVDAKVIDDTEWHHTSMYGNRTTFYKWDEPEYADIYAENRKEIDAMVADSEKEAKAKIASHQAELDAMPAERPYKYEMESEEFRNAKRQLERESYAKADRINNSYIWPLSKEQDAERVSRLQEVWNEREATIRDLEANASESDKTIIAHNKANDEYDNKRAILSHAIDDAKRDSNREFRDKLYDYFASRYDAMQAREAENDGIRYSIVTDKQEIERLNSEPTIKTYRAMQLHDGELYPPMSGKVNGRWQQGIAVSDLGKVWEKADEHPELVDDKGYFTLNKGNGKSLKARYNPYFHSSITPLNDQFSEAQHRPELVTVEVEVPESELTSGYKAEKAKDSVGRLEWKAGVIQSKLTGTRTVILSRWDKPVRIVPDSEVADVIVGMFDGKDITMPSNVVTPQLRVELEKRGVPFVETNNLGKPVEETLNGKENSRTDVRTMPEEEKRKRGEALLQAPAVDAVKGLIKKSDGKSARQSALEWWKENVGEARSYDTEIGIVDIDKKSIGDSLAHGYNQVKLDAVATLNGGFENAVYLGTMPDFSRQEGVSNHYFAYPINYDGKRSYVFCRAMQDANKNRLYLHEVFVVEKLNKESNTLQTAAFQPHGGIALYKSILSDILSATKVVESFENPTVRTEKVADEDNTVKYSIVDEGMPESSSSEAAVILDSIKTYGLSAQMTIEQTDDLLMGLYNDISESTRTLRLPVKRLYQSLNPDSEIAKEMLAHYSGSRGRAEQWKKLQMIIGL